FRKVSSHPTLEVVERKRLMCNSNKLIFEKMYLEEDALIYLDTDLVFLRPIEDLWRAFKNFNDDQLFGAVTPLWRIFSDKPFTELEKNPEHFYEMDCEWNFRRGYCENITQRCPGMVVNGVNVVHGNNGAFFSGENTLFKLLHEYWRDLDMSKSLSTVISELKAILPDAVLKDRSCHFVKGLHEMLMKHLKLLDGKLVN
ncbi:glucoside xylosyltransferase 2-like, partial [Hyalella azteca]|uniref:Glucoside xylosyltransferase 2-like n=1 Tax=Hyalella azteca TaxID=294128 RepID=A0A979FXT6_HYAAZ